MQRIVLDSTEDKIRQTLVSFAAEYSKTIGRPITLRFTGGWVRDKLLGRPSHDIDIAIDSTTGQEFATALQHWMGDKGLKLHGVHTIARNPDKSKHLETATTRLYGLDLDFVNLRSETYSEGSRIPLIEFGTPYEDAMRRDATLNALFYNLELEQVEDFTQRGLSDLQQGILRTPLDPVETFRDDPLRILRLIRFVGQLNFDLDPQVQAAMKSPEAHSDLTRKVSRERVGVELEKLIQGDYASKGLGYMVSMGVNPFSIPEPFKIATGIIPSLEDLQHRLDRTGNVLKNLNISSTQKASIWLATLLEGWEKVEVLDAKKKPHPGPYIIVKEGIKLASQRANLITKLLTMAPVAQSLLESHDRKALGYFVRQCNTDWKLCLLYAGCRFNQPNEFNSLHDRLVSLGLDTAYDVKPILKGSDIMKLYPDRRPGSWLNEAIKLQIAVQLENPSIDQEEIKRLVTESLD